LARYLGIEVQIVQPSTGGCISVALLTAGAIGYRRRRARKNREDALNVMGWSAPWSVAAALTLSLLPGANTWAQSKPTPVRAAYVPVANLAPGLGRARQGHLRQARSRRHPDADPEPVAAARHRRAAVRVRGLDPD